MGERTGLAMGFTTVNGVMSLSEKDKTHNQRLSSSSRSEFLDKLAIFDGIREVSYWIN